jgi:multiple sugar transport system substrate-binding protein
VKRLLKAAVAATALVATTAGFARAAEEVVWWDFLGGGDGVRMKALISDFNNENPDVQIDPTTLDWGVPFYTKVRTSAAVGQGPDVMTYHLSRLPLALSEKVLSPITAEDLAAAGLAESDFFGRPLLQQEAARGDAVPRRRRQSHRHLEPRRVQRRAEGDEGQGRRDAALVRDR